MILKNKIKGLFTICLLSFGLIACDNSPDYSGVYKYRTLYFSFEKLSGNEYKCDSNIGYHAKVEVKNNSVFDGFDKSYKGKFEGDKFIAYGDDVYTKSK